MEMSQERLVAICRATGGYTKPDLNNQLMLNSKGFQRIENLEEYVECNSLWLQQNGLPEIEGLEMLVGLRVLYLQENCITEIEGLSTLKNLNTLNLSSNSLTSVDGIQELISLQTLELSHNQFTSIEGLRGLEALPNLESLDISHNKFEPAGAPGIPSSESAELNKDGPDGWVDFFMTALPGLLCIYTQGNEATSVVRFYRKKMINVLPKLTYLDERPVSAPERRTNDAWARGGYEAESEERQLLADEKRAEMQKDVDWWKGMKDQAREKALAEGRPWNEGGDGDVEGDSDSEPDEAASKSIW